MVCGPLPPNPAQGYFQIEATDKDASYAQMLINYTVIDASGQPLLKGKIRAGSEIPIDQLPSGVYIVKIWAVKIEENHRFWSNKLELPKLNNLLSDLFH